MSTTLHTVKVRVCDHQEYLIKSPIEFVYGCVWDFFHFECIPLCISHILFSSVENTIIFVLTFFLVCWFDFKFKFYCKFWSWMFLNHRKWITSCFHGLKQSPSTLSCIFSVFTDHKSGHFMVSLYIFYNNAKYELFTRIHVFIFLLFLVIVHVLPNYVKRSDHYFVRIIFFYPKKYLFQQWQILILLIGHNTSAL